MNLRITPLLFAWVGCLAASARADEPRPFFNEFSLDGGALYVPNAGAAPLVGFTAASGIDFGPAGFDVFGTFLYAPDTSGTGYTGLTGLAELGTRLVIYTRKVALRVGFVYGFGFFAPGGNLGSSTGEGLGPTASFSYQTSRDAPVYAGFGLDFQTLFMRPNGFGSFGQSLLFALTGQVYLGVRLTVLEHLISRRTRW